MKLYGLGIFFGILSLTAPAMAETVACPDLAGAVQVGTCPSEDELQYTFNGFCSDNARMYSWQEEQVCTDYKLYRRLKNAAMWEAGEGAFQGYVSCDLAVDKVKSAQPKSVAAVSKGKLTRVVCTYTDDITFVYRTKKQCRIDGSGDCGGNPAACKAACE